ncbi:MAG: hypothetical protein VX252_09670 [Myxococcota bacterium]|nr:hypothetical protein [Myxococcota bacterium]
MAEEEKEAIHLPAPTAAPLFFALGLAFLGASLVTNVVFAYVGLVTAVLGAVGWWREMLPREHTEPVAAQPLHERAPAIVPREGAVEHLVIGEGGHRVRLPLEYHPYAAGLRAGIAGGIAMAIMGGIQGLATAGTPWAAFNGFASIVMPLFGAAPPPDMTSFHIGIMVSALAIHLVLSLLIGVVYSSILPMLPGSPRLWGGIVAPLVWTVCGWAAISVVMPTSVMDIRWGWFIASQLAFGLAAGEVIARSPRIQTLQSYTLAGRAGLEASEANRDDEGGTA